MGVITNYLRYVKGSDVKNIFTYASGVATVNKIITHDVTRIINQLLKDGYKLS